MPKTKASAATTSRGRTAKVSVSLEEADLRVLRRRAAKLYGGNLSAAVAEAARRLREEEAREAVVRWLGDASKTSPEVRDAIRREWHAAAPKRGRRRAA